ncbi:MAG: HNH endonuclease [Ruminococcus flavefaciens]|nr:HNH endonuclease [Ruminococcus flavefaciens]
MKKQMIFEEQGDVVTFYKEGWHSVGQIDNIPKIVEMVKTHSWYDKNGYLYCSALSDYLHRLVMQYKIGKDKLDTLTRQGFIVDHLNNDARHNCRLDNLHILSADVNKAKGYTVDKDIQAVWLKAGIGLYLLSNNEYQIAIGFNEKTMIKVESQYKDVSRLYLNFDNFDKCYNAIQIILTYLKGKGDLDITALQATQWECTEPIYLPQEYEKEDGPIIKYGDTYVFRINNTLGPNLAVIDKPVKVEK